MLQCWISISPKTSENLTVSIFSAGIGMWKWEQITLNFGRNILFEISFCYTRQRQNIQWQVSLRKTNNPPPKKQKQTNNENKVKLWRKVNIRHSSQYPESNQDRSFNKEYSTSIEWGTREITLYFNSCCSYEELHQAPSTSTQLISASTQLSATPSTLFGPKCCM